MRLAERKRLEQQRIDDRQHGGRRAEEIRARRIEVNAADFVIAKIVVRGCAGGEITFEHILVRKCAEYACGAPAGWLIRYRSVPCAPETGSGFQARKDAP